MPRNPLNTLSSNRELTASQLAEGAKVDAIIETCVVSVVGDDGKVHSVVDPTKLAAAVKTAGLLFDSAGQIFNKAGMFVPATLDRDVARAASRK